MTEQEILEGNKLIAKFIGRCGKYNKEFYTFKGIDRVLNDDVWYCLSEAKFHSSWDWLMPVVEECLCKVGDSIEGEWHYAEIHDALWAINIDSVYEKVINFIKWYNERISKTND